METIDPPGHSTRSQAAPTRVLLIADYPPLARVLRRLFEEEGFEFDAIAMTDDLARTRRYDVVIIDAMRPGTRTPAQVHTWCHIPGTATLFLTSPSGAEHLFPFADDELVKPFEIEELLSKTRALAYAQRAYAPRRDRKGSRREAVEPSV